MGCTPDNTATIQRGRPFAAGESGNPAGRPRGARNKATVAVQAMLEGEAEKITRKAIDLALAGDTTAIRLVMERLLPPRKDRPVDIALSPIKSPSDLLRAHAEIIQALSNGDVSTQEAATLCSMLEIFGKTFEVVELESRISWLEKGKGNA